MELIRKLGTRLSKTGRIQSWGLFKCICGKEVERVLGNGLKQKSCGCLKIKHGEYKTRLYHTWNSMKQRILNPKHKSYKDYGGKGITICNEWLEFIPFRDWALNNGYADNLVIDRKNPNGNYEPNNCRFLTILESNRNKTNTITMEIANEIRELDKTGKYTRKELAEKSKLNFRVISKIIKDEIWGNKL